MSICILNKISALEAKSQNRVESADNYFDFTINLKVAKPWDHHPPVVLYRADQIIR